jgi:hypothetical protein
MFILDMPWWVIFLIPSKLWILIYLIGFAAVTTVSAWIIGIQMRQRIKKDLGKTADDGDLTSIETWMEVDKVEDKGGAEPGRD